VYVPKISAHFSLKAGLLEVRTDNRHGLAIYLDHEVAIRTVTQFETEYEIWN
jgi:hypothetical protein